MSQDTTREVNGQAATPQFKQLLQTVAGCSRDEKRVLLDRIMRDLIGDKPDQEYAMYNPDNTCYLHLVPPRIRVQLDATPERLAEHARRMASTNWVDNSVFLAKLNEMQRRYEQEG